MHDRDKGPMRPVQQAKGRRLRDLLRDYPRESVRAAFIRHWAACNNISNQALCANGLTNSLLQDADEYHDLPVTQIREAFPHLDLKELEGVLESAMSPEERKSFGAVYTPNYIIDYLISEGLAFGWQAKREPPKIYDPSCGCAGFLIRAAEILRKDYGIMPDEAFRTSLFGSDKDAAALVNARCLIELYLTQYGLQTAGRDLPLFQRDALLDDLTIINRNVGEPATFNLVATNPPYVKLQNLDLEYRARLMQKYPRLTKGSFSLAPLFMLTSQEVLSPQGCLALITQNNLFTSLSGVEARASLQRKKCLRRIIDFGHHKVFEKASAYTCLLFLGASPSNSFEYGSLDNRVDAQSLASATFTMIRHDSLRADKWRLVSEDHAANIQLLETIGSPLGAVAAIKVGFATLKDAVFIVRDRGDRCIAYDADGCPHQIEKDLTRPAVKIADLKSVEDIAGNDRRVIFPYERQGNKYQLIPEHQLVSQYPNAYRYLLASQGALETRDGGKKDYPAWYAWGRTQGLEAAGPKLLTKTFSKRPQFILDRSDQLFCNGYAVSERRDASPFDRVPLAALERILNSTVMHYYAKLTSFQIEGGFQCYQKNFIERFGIVDMTEQQRQELTTLAAHEADNYIVSLYGLSRDVLNRVLCRP